MIKAAFICLTLVTVMTAVNAQQQVRPPAPDILPPGECPSSGYTAPLYGVFGDNDGGTIPYEIAGPCTPKALRDAAEAIGMRRYRPLGVKNVTTIRFFAKGTLANERGTLENVDKVDVSISYVVPAIRLVVDAAGNKNPRQVRVYADEYAWNETEPGVGGKSAQSMLGRRAPLIKLTPFGALWSVIEAEGHAKVVTAGGQTLVTGTSPYDGYEVTTTLDEKHLPVHVRVKAAGKIYEATF